MCFWALMHSYEGVDPLQRQIFSFVVTNVMQSLSVHVSQVCETRLYNTAVYTFALSYEKLGILKPITSDCSKPLLSKGSSYVGLMLLLNHHPLPRVQTMARPAESTSCVTLLCEHPCPDIFSISLQGCWMYSTHNRQSWGDGFRGITTKL